jgi:hypothetical protein
MQVVPAKTAEDNFSYLIIICVLFYFLMIKNALGNTSRWAVG